MSEEQFHIPERYQLIEANNEKSWYLNGSARKLEVVASVASVGPSRERKLGRTVLAGNMSENYGEPGLSKEQWVRNANANVNIFHESLGLDPRKTKILRPQGNYGIPLQRVNVDEVPRESDSSNALWIPQDHSGDLIYTYDPNTVLGVRPADCPVIMASGETPKGRILTLTHIASLGAEAGFVEQMFDHFDELEIDRSTLQVYVTPGAQAENYPYERPENPMRESFEKLFVDVRPAKIKDRKTGDMIDGFKFKFDTPNFVYSELLRLGMAPEQIYADISDTARLDSGYSSNGRAVRYKLETNSRDIMLTKMNDLILNPERPAPQEIAEKIKPVSVRYIGFDGETHEGPMEVHEDLTQDVSDFFEAAYAMRFPIERVVRSSDTEFGWDDDKLMAANTSSGFNYRLIKGTDRPSLHGLGRAFDVNTRVNPYVRYKDGQALTDPEGAVYDPSAPGTLTADHPLVVMMRERGWVWGGDWTEAENGVTDYQHFDKRA